MLILDNRITERNLNIVKIISGVFCTPTILFASIPFIYRGNENVWIYAFALAAFLHIFFHVIVVIVLVLWIARLIIKSKREVINAVGNNHLKLVTWNLFGYTTFSVITFGLISIAVIQNRMEFVLISFALVQVKLTALLWNFQKLKTMALTKPVKLKTPQTPSNLMSPKSPVSPLTPATGSQKLVSPSVEQDDAVSDTKLLTATRQIN